MDGTAHLDVAVRVIAGVDANDDRGWAAIREHADEDEMGIMNPVKKVIGLGLEAGGFKEVDAAHRHGQVRFQLVGYILGRVDVRDGRLGGGWVGGDFNFVS
jgi:hypothetical protein